MAVGCPQLPMVPFTAQDLDKQLDREARRFFAEPRNLERVPATKTVRLSEILKFYPEDFLRRSSRLSMMQTELQSKGKRPMALLPT